ncbi:MAG: FtsW/RodA/SpoVE family cell cycle protein [Bacteroidetes bacterium]|jgi:cell division protein FtsW|nr:FtsW/RodA/SpoVE family cell cycle protein [Bacteroidota bacterium]
MQIGTYIQNRIKGDGWIWLCLVFLSIVSVLSVYSASGSLTHKVGNYTTEVYLFKQIGILVIGFCIAYFVQNVHYMIFGKLSVIALFLSFLLLILTVFYGMEINDARRWLRIPFINASFQTSDFSRLALVVYLAFTLSQRGREASRPQFFLPYILLPIIIICGLIMPSDLSTALMLFATCFILLAVAGINYRLLLAILFALFMVGAIFLALDTFFDIVRSDTWGNRLKTFFVGEGDKYQIIQSKIAIAEGGLFGEGPGNSVQRNFLPSPYADFIYAIIIEEYGLIGGVLLMAVYFVLLGRCFKIVYRSTRSFAALLTVGISMSIILQAMLNMAVSADLVPVTGLNLPFVSMGGTSAIFQFLAIGMILSVSHYSEVQRARDEAMQELEETDSKSPNYSPENLNDDSYD